MNFREKCLQHKEEECEVCGRTESITVHHVDGDRENNELDNLMPICGACHQAVHQRPTPGREEIIELQEKLENKHKDVELECDRCGHEWNYTGTMERGTCSRCGKNIPVNA